MEYKITFSARKRGSIGLPRSFTEIVIAKNEDAAILKLYDKYENLIYSTMNIEPIIRGRR